MKPGRAPSAQPAAVTAAAPAVRGLRAAAGAVTTITAATCANRANRAGESRGGGDSRRRGWAARTVCAPGVPGYAGLGGTHCAGLGGACQGPRAKKGLISGTKNPSLLHCWQALGESEGNGGWPSFAVLYRWWVVRSSYSLSFASARSAFAARPPVLHNP